MEENNIISFTEETITGYPCILENSVGKPIINYRIYGNSVQNGTPSPENPVDVQGVGELLKNSFDTPLYGDGTAENSDTCDLSTGIITRRWGVKVFDGREDWVQGGDPPNVNCLHFFAPKFSGLKPGAIITETINTHFISERASNGSMFGNYYSLYPIKSLLPENAKARDFKSFLASEYAKGTPVTVYYPLAEPTTEKIAIPSGLTGTVIGNTIQNGTPTPEVPIEVVGVDKYDYGYEIPVVSRGKNLVNVPVWANVQSTDTKEYFTLVAIAYMDNTIVSRSPYINISNVGAYSTTVKLTGNINKIYIKHSGSVRDIYIAGVMINATSGQSYTVSMYVESNNPTLLGGIKVKNVQLELGSEATEYEPYRDPITTPIYLPEPLYKGDYIYKDKSGGKVHREWGVKVFDGTEDWLEYSPTSYGKGAQLYLPTMKYGFYQYGLCTHLLTASPTLRAGKIAFGVNDRILYLFGIFNVLGIETIADFKSFLASEYAKGTPVTVYYPLAEPTEEAIELPEIPPFKGTTIIETSTEIQPENIEVTYTSITLMNYLNYGGLKYYHSKIQEQINRKDNILKSTQVSFVLDYTKWEQQLTGEFTYVLQNSYIDETSFIDLRPAIGITQNQLNALLSLKLVITSRTAGEIVLTAFGEIEVVNIPMLLIIEGSYQSIDTIPTIDTALVENGPNAVSSGAVYNEVQILQTTIENLTSQVTQLNNTVSTLEQKVTELSNPTEPVSNNSTEPVSDNSTEPVSENPTEPVNEISTLGLDDSNDTWSDYI